MATIERIQQPRWRLELDDDEIRYIKNLIGKTTSQDDKALGVSRELANALYGLLADTIGGD